MWEHTFLVPRWGGNSYSDWYPWLCKHREINGILDMPSPELPKIEQWTRALISHFEDKEHMLSKTQFITHSIGAHALLKFIEQLHPDILIPNIIMVAAWWEIHKKTWGGFGLEWDNIKPWINYSLDVNKVNKQIASLTVIISNDDPLVPDFVNNMNQWIDKFASTVIVVPKRQHFNNTEEPSLLSFIE